MDGQTDGQTDRRTEDRQTDRVVHACAFAFARARVPASPACLPAYVTGSKKQEEISKEAESCPVTNEALDLRQVRKREWKVREYEGGGRNCIRVMGFEGSVTVFTVKDDADTQAKQRERGAGTCRRAQDR